MSKPRDKWKKLMEGDGPDENQNLRMFNVLAPELEKIQKRKSPASVPRRSWLKWAGGAIATAALGGVILRFLLEETETPIQLTEGEVLELESNPELLFFEPAMVKDAEVIAQMDFYRKLDLLKRWDG